MNFKKPESCYIKQAVLLVEEAKCETKANSEECKRTLVHHVVQLFLDNIAWRHEEQFNCLISFDILESRLMLHRNTILS